MSKKEIKVPNIGEFKNVEIIEILVKIGQELKKNDPLVTIESDKSSIEIPTSHEGTVKSISVKIGDKVSEGDKILEIEINEGIQKKKDFKLVKKESTEKVILKKTLEKKEGTHNISKNNFSSLTLASPKVRKFARELGVDINDVIGTKRKGRVTEDDLKLFVSNLSNQKIENKNNNDEKIEQAYSHSEFGEVEIRDIPRIKKLSSIYLMNSWTNIPHVTNHDEADITELEDFRISLKDIYTGEKKKITPLAFVIKALTASLRKFPNFNSSIDEIDKGKMTIKKYYHIGIAVDTPNG